MTGVEIWEWTTRGMLGLMFAIQTYFVQDYLKWKTRILSQFVTDEQCKSCQQAKNEDMKEIREKLDDGRREFKEISVFMARIDERLKHLDA